MQVRAPWKFFKTKFTIGETWVAVAGGDAFMVDTGPLNDPARTKPVIEQRREWAHSDTAGSGKNCARHGKPVYTEVQRTPDECRSCPSDEWESRGRVLRDKKTKQIVHRVS